MTFPKNFLRRQDGIILFTSLAILAALLMVGLGSRVMLQNDYRVLTNLRGGADAFYLSSAGLEWGKNEIAIATSFPPAPADRTENFARGAFAVSFLAPTAVGPLKAKIVVRSVGTLGSASHTLQAQLTKTYDLVDGAIGLRGSGSRVILNSGGIFISGIDHDPTNGNPDLSAKPRAAVSGDNDSLLALVEQASANLPQGSLQSGGSIATTTASEYLPSAKVSQLANSLCGQGGAILSTVPTAGALLYENQTWGSRAEPQLRCIDGLVDTGDSVTLAGAMSGVGILIVRNSDLLLTGSLHWEGLIIVTGGDVSFKSTGMDNKEVFGGVLVNETGIPSGAKAILDVQGNLRLLFSRQALAQAAALVASSTLNSTYPSLPARLTQDYWRTVTP